MNEQIKHAKTNSNCLEQTKDFINAKKKKTTPSKADCIEFEQLWLSCVKEHGLTEEVFQLLYRGFRFGGATPLFRYLHDASNTGDKSYAVLSKFREVKENSSEIAFRMYLSLLALECVNPTSAQEIIWLMRKIPRAAQNKEGKQSGNVQKYFKNLFVAEIAGHRFAASDLDYSEYKARVSSFARFSYPILKQVKSSSKLNNREEKALADIFSWLADGSGTNLDTLLKQGTAEEKTDVVSVRARGDVGRHESIKDNHSPALTLDAAAVVDFVRGQEARLQDSEVKIADLEKSVSQLTSNLEEKTSALLHSSKESSDYKKRVEELEERAMCLTLELDEMRHAELALHNAMEEKSHKIKSLESELEDKQVMLKIAEESSRKESDAILTKLSRKLGNVFLDFQDGADLEMTVDLGNNMRDSLTDVFACLRDAGLRF